MDAIALSLTNAHKEGSVLITKAAGGIVIGAVANTIYVRTGLPHTIVPSGSTVIKIPVGVNSGSSTE